MAPRQAKLAQAAQQHAAVAVQPSALPRGAAGLCAVRRKRPCGARKPPSWGLQHQGPDEPLLEQVGHPGEDQGAAGVEVRALVLREAGAHAGPAGSPERGELGVPAPEAHDVEAPRQGTPGHWHQLAPR
eukprot:9279410-Lingulodinium_polyedra.AAC.1